MLIFLILIIVFMIYSFNARLIRAGKVRLNTKSYTPERYPVFLMIDNFTYDLNFFYIII